VQEIAFTIANGIAYVQAAVDAGMAVDDFASRLSFFWNAHNNLFEEVAKYRAARRHVGPDHDRALRCPGRALQAPPLPHPDRGIHPDRQQPEDNIARVTVQALAAALGGTQSLHTDGFDEALGLPTDGRAAKISLRTQLVLQHESGITDTPDPLAGSYFVESLTDEVRGAGVGVPGEDRRHGRGRGRHRGPATCRDEIEQGRYAYARAIDDGQKVIVGVNRYAEEPPPARPRSSPSTPSSSASRPTGWPRVRKERDQAAVAAALARRGRRRPGHPEPAVFPMKESPPVASHSRGSERHPPGRVSANLTQPSR